MNRLPSPIGIGFVGLGARRGWARQAHLPALAMLGGDFVVRGLVASTPASAQASAQPDGIAFATDRLEALLERDDIELVVITVRVPEHRRAVEAALRAGRAVFCEWPLARDLDEAVALQAIAKDSARPCFVGLQARASPVLRHVADLIGDGRLGDLLSTSVLADGGAPWGRDTIDLDAAMYQDDSNGASMLTIPCGHLLDALQQLFGELGDLRALLAVRRPQVRLRDSGETLAVTAPDQVCISGRCSSGVIANLHYRSGQRGGTRLQWEINGTGGSLLLEADSGHLQFGRPRLRAALGTDEFTELEVPDSRWPLTGHRSGLAYNVALTYAAIARDLREGTATAPHIGNAVALHRQLAAIRAAAA